MRVDAHKDRGERRDAIDQRLIRFLSTCQLTPVLIPNNKKAASFLLESIDLKGILFSGGNVISSIDDQESPERSEVELCLFQWFAQKKLPIFGICHGMQFIQEMYGVRLQRITGHVGLSHSITSIFGNRIVNSYHDHGSYETVANLEVSSRSNDGVIESVVDVEKNVLGIMWHPEREESFLTQDIDMVKKHFYV